MTDTVTPIDTEHLPEGDEKAVAVQAMFDRIAPRYDLVNRIMTFRLDVGWRRQTVRALRLPMGSRVLDLACGTGDLCRELEHASLRPIGVDFSFGMLSRARTACATRAGRRPATARARREHRRRDLWVRPAELRRPGRLLRRAGSRRPARTAMSRCSRWPSPGRACSGSGHGVYFGKVVPRIGGLLSDGSAYRYLPKSVAYLPPPTTMLDMLPRHGVRGRGTAAVVRGHRPTHHRHPVGRGAMTAVTGGDASARRRRRPGGVGRRGRRVVDPRPRRVCRAGPGTADRRTATRSSHRRQSRARCARPHRDRRRGRTAGHRPRRRGRAALRSNRARRTRGPRAVWSVGPTTAPAGSPRSAPTRVHRACPPSAPERGPEPTSFRVESERPVDAWCADLVAARQRLRDGDADKVVLARAVRVEADAPLSRGTIAERLRAAYPSCMLYSVDGFVGASPELLVARAGDVVRCHPMAGTAPRSDDPSTDARLAASLISSTKDQREHRVTIDMVHDTLLPWCSYLDEEAEPSIVAMANVQHLATLVEGRLSTPPASIIELMTALHPTPAVGGSPRVGRPGSDRPVRAPRPRSLRRAGRVGRRCRQRRVGGRHPLGRARRAAARLFAGVGVLPRSDVEAELAETRAKLQALLGAIVRP